MNLSSHFRVLLYLIVINISLLVVHGQDSFNMNALNRVVVIEAVDEIELEIDAIQRLDTFADENFTSSVSIIMINLNKIENEYKRIIQTNQGGKENSYIEFKGGIRLGQLLVLSTRQPEMQREVPSLARQLKGVMTKFRNQIDPRGKIKTGVKKREPISYVHWKSALNGAIKNMDEALKEQEAGRLEVIARSFLDLCNRESITGMNDFNRSTQAVIERYKTKMTAQSEIVIEYCQDKNIVAAKYHISKIKSQLKMLP